MRCPFRLHCLLCLIVLWAWGNRALAGEDDVPQKLAALERLLSVGDGPVVWAGLRESVRAAVLELNDERLAALRDQSGLRSLPLEALPLWRELQEAVRQQRVAHHATLDQRVEQFIEKARQTCLTAKDGAELNALLVGLDVLRDELSAEPGAPRKVQGMIARLGRVEKEVGSWQDMLAFRAAGYDEKADKLRRGGERFVSGKESFKGPQNVVATLNGDGSLDITWENMPGEDDDEEIDLMDLDKNGNWVVIARAPAGSTSYHLAADAPPPPPKPKGNKPPGK